MSVILEALKKLDRERLSRRNGAPNIAVEILRADLPRPRKRIFLYFVAVSIATAAITYGVMVEFGFLLTSMPPTPMNPPVSNQPVSSAPSEASFQPESSPPTPTSFSIPTKQVSDAPSEASFQPESSPPTPTNFSVPTKQVSDVPSEASFQPKSSPPTPSNSSMPTKQVSDVPSEPALSESIPLPAVTPVAPPESPEPPRISQDQTMRVAPRINGNTGNKIPSVFPDEKKTSKNLISEEAKVAPAETVSLPEQIPYIPYRSPTTPLSLRISGIIWSEEPSNRIAVINGASFTEGSIIEGVKVVEIHRNRVRFLRNSRIFEVPLGVSYTIEE